ncbi:NAD(P)H-binding protein [Tsukamurella sp. 8F]|uniref:SDR family oxidoreductase n=1 Tax=Tsukamurella sp. 8F TaxID=3031961 RepID=UPI0023B93B87|nr:NAD(P)H-binding protein [Tsukamurella sp. 8F]MDF0586073.1 NAD(P)H-binding protein [Tsukamurella sp. 8F]
MRIAVIGATGTAGSLTTAAARRAGHEVVEISRSTGVDLHTGAGLAAALEGVDAVIDASNAFPTDPDQDVVEAFAIATSHVVAACAAAEAHLVHLSIEGIDLPDFDGFAYYLAKREQERIIRESGVSSTIVRSAQWFEFATNPAAVSFTDDRVTVQDWLVQPIAAETVARVLVDECGTRGAARSIAGPEAIALPELTARVLAAHGDERPVESVPAALPGLSRGILLARDGAELLGPDLDAWLAA